jgi:hypothetical protein
MSTQITVQSSDGTVAMAGIDLDGNYFLNESMVMALVKNTSIFNKYIRFVGQSACGEDRLHNLDVPLPLGGDYKFVGPISRQQFNDQNKITNLEWLDSAKNPLADGTGVSIGLIALARKPLAATLFPDITGVTSLPNPVELPIIGPGTSLVFYQPDVTNGNMYRLKSTEIVIIVNARPAETIYVRILAYGECVQGHMHHLDIPVLPGGAYRIIAPINRLVYGHRGYAKLAWVDSDGDPLANNTNLGVTAVRPVEVR